MLVVHTSSDELRRAITDFVPYLNSARWHEALTGPVRRCFG